MVWTGDRLRRCSTLLGSDMMDRLEIQLPPSTIVAVAEAIHPVLEDIMGGVGAWGEGADLGSRWSSLLASGHRDGVAMGQSWTKMKQEAIEKNWTA